MAEAEVETRQPACTYFCHKCNAEITPELPEYVCPRCNCGFIEHVRVHTPSNSDDQSDDSDDYPLFEERRAEPLRSRRRRERRLPNYLRLAEHPRFRRRREEFNFPNIDEVISIRHMQMAQRREHISLNDLSTRQPGDTPSITSIQELIMQLTSGVLESVGGSGEFSLVPGGMDPPGFPMFVASNLASNPGDYAWGRGGLDTIITQLMNQLNGTGPPPLKQEKINQIPKVMINQEQCDKNLQCSVCMEDFILNTTVRKLNCEHCYHEECIIPWLKLHGTCPVCRKMLDPESAALSDYDHNYQNDEESSNSEESTSRRLRNSSNSANLMEEELD